MAKTKEQLLNILDQFQLDEKVVSAEPFGNGHINDTLKVTNEKGEIKYVLQRINHLIFTNVDMLQNNIHVVTTHIRKKLEEKGETDIDRKVLTFLPTKDGKKYYVMSPSEITDDLRDQAATDYAKFMTTDTYKNYTKAYNVFVKKNPGYEEKIANKLNAE